MMKRHFVLLVALLVAGACAHLGTAADPVIAAQQCRPRILVSNDDGYAAAGIAALAEELATFADVVVVAPLENQSGASQSTKALLNNAGAIVHEVAIGAGMKAYAVEGSPADCVFYGIDVLGRAEPFDLVVSGINHGPNHGIGYLYSGTVGAAFQALTQGVSAIAVSQSNSRGELQTAAEFTGRVARQLLAEPLADGVALSINVPAGEIRGAVAAPPGGNPYTIELVQIEKNGPVRVYKAKFTPADVLQPGHDVQAYADGYITVTPLQLDRTHRPSLERLERWDFITAPQPQEQRQ